MVAGCVPFDARDLLDQIVAIQEEPHTPLSKVVEHVPPQLERIIDKALAKNPDKRYQTATDMLVDMRSLKRHLENQAENDRTAISITATLDSWAARWGAIKRATSLKAVRIPFRVQSTSSIKLLAQAWRDINCGSVGVCIAGDAVLVFQAHARCAADRQRHHSSQRIRKQDREEVFDRTLRQGLAVQLQQSPFLDIFPETRNSAQRCSS